jgi:hypothetical protein
MEESVAGISPAQTQQPDLVQAPLQNEPATETSSPGKDSTLEKLKRITKGVFEWKGTYYKRMGKPPKDGSPGKLDIPLSAPANNLPLGTAKNPPVDTPSLDSEMVKKCCSAVLKAFSGFLDNLLFSKAKKAGYEAREAQELVTRCAITTKEADAFSELAEVCLRKYGVGTEYCPEIGLGCIFLGIGARYTVALRALKADVEVPPPNSVPITQANSSN